jgi:hypothetical protein
VERTRTLIVARELRTSVTPHYGISMATNTNLHLARTTSELPGSEGAHLAQIAFSAGWSRARQAYTCAGPGTTHEIGAGALYFSARLASGTVRLCRSCADEPHLAVAVVDPFDFDGAA